jgi:type I site-specific restriction endonuclease
MSNFKSNKTDGSESLFGEVIFSYTRAQAIADGLLADATRSV